MYYIYISCVLKKHVLCICRIHVNFICFSCILHTYGEYIHNTCEDFHMYYAYEIYVSEFSSIWMWYFLRMKYVWNFYVLYICNFYECDLFSSCICHTKTCLYLQRYKNIWTIQHNGCTITYTCLEKMHFYIGIFILHMIFHHSNKKHRS